MCLSPLGAAQIMLWERKLMLEKEMHEAMDPSVGQDVVGEMKREIHRMNLRHAELMKLQEKLMVVSAVALAAAVAGAVRMGRRRRLTRHAPCRAPLVAQSCTQMRTTLLKLPSGVARTGGRAVWLLAAEG